MAKSVDLVVTIEEHVLNGGLGGDILNIMDQFLQNAAKGLEKLLGEPPSKREEKR